MTFPEAVDRILVVTAHPDDVDFGVAGSVAQWSADGVEVAYCVVTDGEAGGSDASIPRSEMASIRRAEQTAAAKLVGVTDLTFLGYPDGRVESSVELRRDITRVIRQFRPQRLVCQSPERNYRRIYASHPDHLAVGDSTLAAVYPDARNPFAHPELLADGLEPWTVPEVLIMAAIDADAYVDITDTVDRKLDALRAHVSQMPDPAHLEVIVREWGTAVARAGGLSDGRLAEGFLLVDTQ
jgi:LmbE family N-acetylglucosaminyl deacetylase